MNHQRIVVAGETLIIKENIFRETFLKMLPRDPPPGRGVFFVVSPFAFQAYSRYNSQSQTPPWCSLERLNRWIIENAIIMLSYGMQPSLL